MEKPEDNKNENLSPVITNLSDGQDEDELVNLDENQDANKN